jgi:hypothetical protein
MQPTWSIDEPAAADLNVIGLFSISVPTTALACQKDAPFRASCMLAHIRTWPEVRQCKLNTDATPTSTRDNVVKTTALSVVVLARARGEFVVEGPCPHHAQSHPLRPKRNIYSSRDMLVEI